MPNQRKELLALQKNLLYRRIHDHLPQAAVYEDFVELVPASGGRLKGLCPFSISERGQAEKSPSFFVRRNGQAHCFHCGWGGGRISFLARIKWLALLRDMERKAELVKSGHLSLEDHILLESVLRAQTYKELLRASREEIIERYGHVVDNVPYRRLVARKRGLRERKKRKNRKAASKL